MSRGYPRPLHSPPSASFITQLCVYLTRRPRSRPGSENSEWLSCAGAASSTHNSIIRRKPKYVNTNIYGYNVPIFAYSLSSAGVCCRHQEVVWSWSCVCGMSDRQGEGLSPCAAKAKKGRKPECRRQLWHHFKDNCITFFKKKVNQFLISPKPGGQHYL